MHEDKPMEVYFYFSLTPIREHHFWRNMLHDGRDELSVESRWLPSPKLICYSSLESDLPGKIA